MSSYPENPAAGGETPRRLCVYNGGFLTQPRIRRILALAGWNVSLGKPGPDDWVGTWGKSPTSGRGEAVAARRDAPLVRVEDAFLRSLHPGRSGDKPLGLLLDDMGVHFDSSTPSRLEHILTTHPLDDGALLNRARDAIDRLQRAHLSKYNAFDPDLPIPHADERYVVVIDQTRGDASIEHAGARASTFREMLVFAQEEHPGAQILIKTHPETAQGHRDGHYSPEDETDRVTLVTDPVSPWRLMEGAQGVYTVSSGLGFEAILAGHSPRVFGQPFYSGWGLSRDENPVPRRERKLTRAQLFAAAMILYPTWYDPFTDQLCEVERVIDTLEARARAWRADRHGYTAAGMRAWKRKPLNAIFGQVTPIRFQDTPTPGRTHMVWGADGDGLHVEDGFLRSRGLGAELTPPMSLVVDDLGIYYDPSRESRLERLIADAPALPAHASLRAERLVARITRGGLSKYNLERAVPDLPEGRRILVPGQVEDDASIRLGCGAICTNLGLLEAARAANPDAVIVFKPHPDVEAGLRQGAVDADAAAQLADVVADQADPIALIEACDAVWTLTSLMGFEALVRGKEVTTLGAPFYAGWGLTRDQGEVPARRKARPTVVQLAHAVLIDYPRYYDPVTRQTCPPEVVAERLAGGDLPSPGAANRSLAKLQGWFSGLSHLWR
ncbi:capsular polysaccharide biosynthesis protein [Aliiroseovarius subalbicans]|uniref:capsular polysaccharide biosynthesis protein n=1 Tax=Aliiroseovarius subalbicans TaxID=2925840 RepID=UPI001F5808EE|nr:capsular polysaccharide biosynthesis protein [uncultured Aliiroseovarius sp.]MCI2398577.1 capsular polysaccharide biosynthesis protein [Aliiroseovarius subalbicans]